MSGRIIGFRKVEQLKLYFASMRQIATVEHYALFSMLSGADVNHSSRYSMDNDLVPPFCTPPRKGTKTGKLSTSQTIKFNEILRSATFVVI